MANICTFGIEATGEPCQLQALMDFVKQGVEELETPRNEKYILKIDLLYDDLQDDEHKSIWLDEGAPRPNDDVFILAEGAFRLSTDRSRILLHGASKWAPPGPLVKRLSKAYPDVTFNYGGTTEHELSEGWTCQGGVSICDYYVVLDIQNEKEMWHIRDGKAVLPLERTGGDEEELPELEARANDIVQ